jgi:hypothetical protein
MLYYCACCGLLSYVIINWCRTWITYNTFILLTAVCNIQWLDNSVKGSHCCISVTIPSALYWWQGHVAQICVSMATMGVGYVILQALRDLWNVDLLHFWLVKLKKKNLIKRNTSFFEKRVEFFCAQPTARHKDDGRILMGDNSGVAGSSVIWVWISAGIFSIADDMCVRLRLAPDLLERNCCVTFRNRASYI